MEETSIDATFGIQQSAMESATGVAESLACLWAAVEAELHPVTNLQ